MVDSRTVKRWRYITGKLLAGLAVGMVFLLLLEGGARLLPINRWERDNPNLSYPLFIPGKGEAAGQLVTNQHYAKVMSLQRFAKVKPAGVKRVFVLGGSAANGWPWAIESAFTGYLHRALDQVAPGRYEIINAAAMGFGSLRVLDLLADVVHMEPDLVIIWSGSNEYVDLQMHPHFASNQGMVRLQRVLRHSRLYRALRLLLLNGVPDLFVAHERQDLTHLRENLPAERTITARSSEIDRQVRANFRDNLEAMADLLREHGVTGAFCTIPVNLSGWSPQNVPPDTTTEWRRLQEEAFLLYDQNRSAEAAVVLEQLLGMTPQYAFGHYLLGNSYRHLGWDVNARKSFQAACDLDPRPLRATSVIQQMIKEVAFAYEMHLVDLEQSFARFSGRELVGLDLFLDHVHLGDMGNRLAAIAVLPVMKATIDESLPEVRLEELIWQDTLSPLHELNVIDITYVQGMTYLNNGDLGKAEQSFQLVLELAPDFPEPAGALGEIYERQGDSAAAVKVYRQALSFDPGSPHAQGLIRVLYWEKNFAEAHRVGEQMRKQPIRDAKLFVNLGDIALKYGDFAEALSMFQHALTLGEDMTELGLRIAKASQGVQMGSEVLVR